VTKVTGLLSLFIVTFSLPLSDSTLCESVVKELLLKSNKGDTFLFIVSVLLFGFYTPEFIYNKINSEKLNYLK